MTSSSTNGEANGHHAPPPDHGHAATTHAVIKDGRNDTILIGMRDGVTGEFRLVPRNEAVVSVFDSAFMLGDGIWEGLRSKRGVIQFATDHLDRLYQSAKAMCECEPEFGIVLYPVS